MTWFALVVAILAVPAVLLDRRWALGLALLASALAVALLARSGRTRVAIAALVVAALAGGLTGWGAWEAHRPASTAAIDEAPYRRAGTTREVMLPLVVHSAPITKLALLQFAPDADEVYAALEPQWLDGPGERGWRVIAYRHDGYVDFYDDHALTIDPATRSQVTGKGLHDHVNVDLSGTVFERDDRGRAHIHVSFTDTAGRLIAVRIDESTTRRSAPTNLLAPVGTGSVAPDYLPLFIMNEFDFIRLGGTRFDAAIDGRPAGLEPFPVPLPMQGQRRSYARYTTDAEIIAVFDATVATLPTATTRPGTDVVDRDGVEYLFAGDGLERIRVNNSEIVFEPVLDLTSTGEGQVTITSYPEHGTIEAAYRITGDEEAAELAIDVDRVTVPHQRDLLSRLIVNDRTVFGTWPTKYQFRAEYDLADGRVDATWLNTGAS